MPAASDRERTRCAGQLYRPAAPSYRDDAQLVVLFGAKARGDFGDESDLDVLVKVMDVATRRAIATGAERFVARVAQYLQDAGAID